MTRIGINGFGRIGRLAFRAAWGRDDLSIVHINEFKGGPHTAAHLLEFDSVHRKWLKRIEATHDSIYVENRKITFTDASQPGDVPWKASAVDLVLECSGKMLTPETLKPYFSRGVKKVLVAAPVKQGALNLVMGVNDHLYDPEEHDIVTAASCTTNCLAPIVKVIHEGLGIRHGLVTTIHDVTNTQTIVDAPHKDLRRARSALVSLVPTTTGSATAITLIYPRF
jgi:glyceraldehyde 3-phosphate dehydrogenase